MSKWGQTIFRYPRFGKPYSVYGFVPNDGSLDALIEKRGTELASQMVMRTANTTKLEDQANSKKRIEPAIRKRATAIKNEMVEYIS